MSNLPESLSVSADISGGVRWPQLHLPTSPDMWGMLGTPVTAETALFLTPLESPTHATCYLLTSASLHNIIPNPYYKQY